MKNTTRLLDVLDCAENGPIVEEQQHDMLTIPGVMADLRQNFDVQAAQPHRRRNHPLRRRARAREYAPAARSRWHAQLQAYQAMPAAELLVAQRVELSLDLHTLISRPGVRVNCEICGEEILNEREIVHEGTVLCRACKGEAYYTVMEAIGETVEA